VQRIAVTIALALTIAFSVCAVVIVRRSSSTVEGDLGTDYFVLALLWIIWGAAHSGMCSVTAFEFFKRRLGTYYRFYRLFFNFVAITTIIPVILYSHAIEGHILFRWDGFLIAFQALLLTVGAMVWIAGARQYDMIQFFGFRQITTGASHSVLTKTGTFDTSGILGATRHPWYLAGLVLIWAHDHSMTIATLVTCVLLTAYLVAGTIIEERKLVMEFGEAYREYQRRVSMLVPLKWLKSRILRVCVVSPRLEGSQDDSSTLRD